MNLKRYPLSATMFLFVVVTHFSILPSRCFAGDVAACCTEDQCQLLSELECEDAGGYFLAPPNLLVAITSCGAGKCITGSCCQGLGVCFDHDGSDQPYTLSNCTLDGGQYTGGAPCNGGTCNNDPTLSCWQDTDCDRSGGVNCEGSLSALSQPSPCPICEIEGSRNCQQFDNNNTWLQISDLGRVGQPTLADDFVPLSDTLSSLCVWGAYLRVYENENFSADPGCAGDVGPDGDRFRVRVYANSANDLPDTNVLIGESLLTSTTKGILEIPTPLTEFFGHGPVDTYVANLVLDPPITGMVIDGRRYWIEVVNDLSNFSDCNWWWWQLTEEASEGNHHSATGSYSIYDEAAADVNDMVMCLGTDFETPTTPVYPCCFCNSATCSMETQVDCRTLNGFWNIDGNDCGSVFCEAGTPSNDSCMTPIEIPSVPHREQFNTVCADTDGYNPIQSEFGPDALGSDLWYTYTTTENCRLTASMCATGSAYDSMLAMYSFGTSECPCPLDLSTHVMSFIEASDEGCTVEVSGGAGYVTTQTQADVCYTIRVGAWAPATTRGVGVLDIECIPLGIIIHPVLPDPVGPGALACDGGDSHGLPCMTCSGGSRDGQLCLSDSDCGGSTCIANDTLCAGGTCSGPFPWPKSRYVGFRANVDEAWEGQNVAIRVTLIDVKDHPECNGQLRWVGPPTVYCESGVCAETFMASALQDTPYYADWALQGVVLVVGEEVIPQSRYGLQAIHEEHANALNNENNYSVPVLLIDTGKWGDVISPFDRFTSSSQPSISDVLALVDKWLGNLEPRKSRSQLQPAVLNLNSSVGIADVLKGVDAWLGSPYPYSIDSCVP